MDFVGGMSTGTMADKNHEGHRGYVIDEIREVSGVGIHAGANIVLLHAGTNDMKNDINPAGAPERLKKLIDEIYEFSPDTVILLCNLIPAGPDRYPATVPRIDKFNEAIPVIATEYVTVRKKKMLVVGMNHGVTLNDLADSLHPNDVGYGKMAELFYSAIESVDERGWISKPGKKTPVPDSTSPENCKSTPSWYNVGMIATGAKVYVIPILPSMILRRMLRYFLGLILMALSCPLGTSEALLLRVIALALDFTSWTSTAMV